MQESKLKNYILLHFVVFVWGFTAILGALIPLGAIPLVFIRMWMAVFFIGLYCIYNKQNLKIDFKRGINFTISGLIIATHWILFFEAIKVSNVSVALVTISTGAFFTSLLEPIFFKRKINPLEMFLGLIVVVGLYVIFNFERQYKLGIIYALIAASLSALFSVVNGILIKKNHPTTMSFYQLLLGVIVVTVFMLVKDGFPLETFQTLKPKDWFYLFILSSICTAWAFIACTKVLKSLTPFTVMLTINLEPVYAIILALLIFGEKEQMNAGFYFGAFIILFVVLLNGVLKNSKKLKNRFNK